MKQLFALAISIVLSGAQVLPQPPRAPYRSAGIPAGRAPAPTRPQSHIAGTYRLVVCQQDSCSPGDTLHAVAWGTLVLLEGTIRDSVPVKSDYLSGPANGCYRLHHLGVVRSLAGLEEVGTTHWRLYKGLVSFTLYRSPDAAHDVRAMLVGDTLRGTGRSWEIMRHEPYPTDVVVAVRVGLPSVARCWT